MERSNPYAELPASSYWKLGAAASPDGPFEDIWKPKFAIVPEDTFLTAGSCFAQHISRWLRGHGYSWIDTEPTPAGIDDEQTARDGYGVFSFRTGNIYTAALLRQWVSWALGRDVPPGADDVAVEGGRYYDLFRPTIPEAGHGSESEFRAARDVTLAAIRTGLSQATTFIFTLGLTETWIEAATGNVYPLCPGTVRGSFDAERHRFVNAGYEAVLDDLEFTFDAIRSVNDRVRFLLTVSPVPLTATASADHVLTATIYSKSVLRAAAGAMAARYHDVDYFPSYELITTHTSRGRHYEDNFRTVRQTGVDFVMAHFAAAIGAATPPPTRLTAAVAEAAGVICEDALLEQQLKINAADSNLLLVGSSHMARLSDALGELQVPHSGGIIMDGSKWYRDVFALDDEEYFVPLQSRASRRAWENALPFFGSAAPGRTIVTDLAMHTHMAIPELRTHLEAHPPAASGQHPAVEFYVQTHARLLMLLRRFIDEGFNIWAITDPPTQYVGGFEAADLGMFELYDVAAEQVLTAIGARVLLARREFADNWGPEYESDQFLPDVPSQRDWIHGSPAYYRALATRLVEHLPESGLRLSGQ